MANHDQTNGPSPVELICVPWSVGLRPDAAGAEPGTWSAPRALREAGLGRRLGAVAITELPRPPYQAEAQPGTRVRNGVTLREHSLLLADAVSDAIAGGRLPVVIGGDCSVLLGCLGGARRHHEIALVHIDGHPDFTHPGNHDFAALGAAAGMGLALATGRGELLLTRWPSLNGPLVEDRHVVQLGDRTGQALPPGLLVIGIDELLAMVWMRQRAEPSNISEPRTRSGCTSTSTCSTQRSCRLSTHRERRPHFRGVDPAAVSAAANRSHPRRRCHDL